MCNGPVIGQVCTKKKKEPIGSDKSYWSEIVLAAVVRFTIRLGISAFSRFVAGNHPVLRRYVIYIIERSVDAIFLSPFITNRLA